MKKGRVLLFSFVLLCHAFSFGQIPSDEDRWVDSVYASLTLSERIGQLMMIEAYSDRGPEHEQKLLGIMEEFGIGGVMFKTGGPHRQAQLTETLQKHSAVPLLIAIDAEWGLSMRLDSTPVYPWMMTQGALPNTLLTYEFGRQLARECKAVGIHVNFAPVADVNSNPNNPIINTRSFGEDPQKVGDFAEAYLRGLQDGGVMACVKHFPGHGNTQSDSHKTLPTIADSRADLDRVEFAPFRQLFDAGAASVMIAHLNIPALKTGGEASSLSSNVVQKLLREEMGFEGLAFTDGLNMKAVSARFEPGDLEVRALQAGNDVLLLPADLSAARKAIVEALNRGKWGYDDLEDRCKRILRSKYRYARTAFQYNATEIDAVLKDPEVERITRSIFQKAQTLLVNRNALVPLQLNSGPNFHWVHFGAAPAEDFGASLERYHTLSSRVHADEMSEEQWSDWMSELDSNDVVIASVHKSNASPWKSYTLSDATLTRLAKLSNGHSRSVLVLFANPYALLPAINQLEFSSVLLSYQNHPFSKDYAAQVLFGARRAEGRVPVSIGVEYPRGAGVAPDVTGTLRFGSPAEEGVRADVLSEIDSICLEGIREGAMPGCQVLVARNGNVLYERSFGHIAPGLRPVENTDLYDLASITKIAATTLVLMRMVDEGALDLNATLGDYDASLVGSNKANLVIREVLAHQAGLKSWIPFYVDFLQPDTNLPDTQWVYPSPRESSLRVSEQWWAHPAVVDSIYKRLIQSDLLPTNLYMYSDLGYYLLKRIIEEHYQQPLDEIVQEMFYRPMGAATLGYNPLRNHPVEQIVPTEDDSYFRHEFIRGYVHDPGTALLGGVGGHAGLFSSARDLAKLMQMYLNGGIYAGERYLSDSVIAEFTRCQYCDRDNRRGIGFDKPVVNGTGGPSCNCVSLVSFGHTGFTGTLAWVDPEEQIVYIFLSNRICPSAENRKLINMDIRTRIQEVIYNAIN